MSKEMSVIVLGVWIVLATQLGIPFHPWLSLLFALSGIALTVIGLLLRGEAISRRVGSVKHDAFVDHVPTETESIQSPAHETQRIQ